ncbi:MAG: DUF72 domain-containing protein [Synergistaceae bacterium]|jgi:uncharacterized protein YecE (DUF72 family)|nr:DUF72 domain-containing protein [Synergistaceae bacterium]
MASGVRVGICSWTDKTLLKSGFYPSGAAIPARRLQYYASCFDIVEIDSSYYAIPGVDDAFRWRAGTPRDFLFGVKAFSLFTFHRAKFASLPGWLRSELGERPPSALVRRSDLSHGQRMRLFAEFMKPVEVLHSSGRLAYLLFQFPPGWRFSREGVVYFRRIREVVGPMPVAVEVRNNSWFDAGNRDKFLGALSEQNIAYVAVDEPAMGWTVPPEWPITAEWGTVARFHGRNRRGWGNPRASVHERFDYEYDRSELADWAERTKELVRDFEGSKKIYLMYNNCVSDKAVRGARLMAELLGVSLPGSPRLQSFLKLE